jgi:ribosome biogenesis GTPase / thiamine phosphate phosphatase
MRELAQWLDEDADQAAFDDIAELAEGCKFRDCQHRAEPGCAVRAAVDAGALQGARLASFHKLDEERAVGAVKQETARRLAETRKAKAKKSGPTPGKPDDEAK